MAGNVVNVGVLVKTTGLKEGVDQSAQFANNMEKVNTAATKASKAIASSGKAAATASNATNAPTGISTVTDKDYAKVRGAVGTGAAGRDFAKQAQGLGGLVALYATFAANIFAVGAAFEALNKAAQVERLAKATELMSSQVGVNLKSISKNLVEASGHALSFAEAMQFTNIGTSAGLAGKQVENLTKIAKGAAIALGRDVGDSVRRIIQGTAKQEQEILDELGIFVKSKQAFDKYAATIGVKVDALTGTQRTQAYANEVERLGKKWEQFAEIDDPFSRFTATGKNALNDLLAGVNSLFTPLLSFLAQSKEGIQGIIVLVATMLSKRALPELGNMLNNIFTFDKQVAINKAIEARSAIGKELAALEKQALDTKKAMESIKIGATTTDTISSGLGVTPYIKGGQKDISATKLANTFNKTPEAYLTILDAEKSTLGIMKEQLKASKNKDLLLSSLIEKGRLEGKSTLDNLILGEKGKGIAIAMNAKANEAIVLERQKVSLAEINLAIEEKTLALKKAGGALTNQQNTLSKLGTAKNAINTAASEGSRAIDAAIPQGFGPFNTKTALATWEAIKSVSAASKTASVGLSGMATASLLASTATNILGIALKGALAFLGPLAMALMTAYTVWSIFGETIKEYLPNWAKVLMGWDEGTKKSEAAKEKLDEYNKSLGYSAAQMQMLNETRTKGFESAEEEARYADALLKNILSTTEAYKKYTEEKQVAAAEDKLDAARKAGGKSFSEDAYRLRQLAETYKDLVPSETTNQMKVLADNMAIATGHIADAKKGTADYVFWENKLIEARTESARINNDIILPATQKNASATTASASAVSLLSKEFDLLGESAKKARDPILNLGEHGKVIYENLSTVFNGTATSSNVLSDTMTSLVGVIHGGGVSAARAIPLYHMLSSILKGASTIDGKGGISYDIAKANEAIKKALADPAYKQLAALMAGLAGTGDKPVKAPKAAPDYTKSQKEAMRALTAEINAAKLAQKAYDLETANTKAIDERTVSIIGYKTASIIAQEEITAITKAESDKQIAIMSALSTLRNELDRASSTKESKAAAIATYVDTVNIAIASENASVQAAKLATVNSQVSATLAQQTQAYDLLSAKRSANNTLADQELEQLEDYIATYNSKLNLSKEEEAYEERAKVLRSAALAYAKEIVKLEDDKNKKIDALKTKSTDSNGTLLISPEVYAQAVQDILSFGAVAQSTADSTLGHVVQISETAVTAAATAAARSKSLLAGAQDGFKAYKNSISSFAEGSQEIVTKAFKGMEDALANFVQTGKLDFNSLATSIINDMIRISIQQSITGPLANMGMNLIASMFNPTAAAVSGTPTMITPGYESAANPFAGVAAKGKAFVGGIEAFAKGGTFTNSIVNQPTVFKFAQGTGLMGEAGPEAIMPLKRDSSGNLGVRAGTQQTQPANITINIVESAEKAGTQERKMDNGTDMITVFVEKVKSAIASDISRGRGSVPGALSKTYGLNRVAGAY